MKKTLCCLLLAFAVLPIKAQNNPDQITVFFPAFSGPASLGRNVSTLLSLQLAQTTRKYPWPDNPDNLNFGRGMIKWSPQVYSVSQYNAALEMAQSSKLLAQMMVLGKAQRYASEVIVEVDILLPAYQSANQPCSLGSGQPCDFRQKNFENWQLQCDQQSLNTPVPRRRYNISGIVLRDEVVAQFSEIKGLPINRDLGSREVIGYTGDDLLFIEFNRTLPGAPTKLRSNGVEGYVNLPKISEKSSEFADMAGGLLQIFRGDWQAAQSSFSRVLENEMTRIPLKVDAYLLRGMVAFRQGSNGLSDIRQASQLAPYDAGAARYLITAMLAADAPSDTVRETLKAHQFLFASDDDWLAALSSFIACRDNAS